MAWYQNYEKAETKHERFQNTSKTLYDSEGYTPVKSQTEEEKGKFSHNIEQYYRFVSWGRWYPDLFLDMLRPKINGELGGINLHFDQRVFLRAALRFFDMYGTFPRAWGKTFCEIAACFVASILYPGVEISLTAQTKEAAAKLLKDKYKDLIGKYPLLQNEIIDIKQAKDDVEYVFTNGSRITNLANNDSSKGQRRNRMMIEESALLDNDMYEEALKPIADMGRMTKGHLGMIDPLEQNGQIHFFTTSGFRGSTEWQRNITMFNRMLNCTGDFVLGADWKLACWFGRGQTKQQVLDTKSKYSAIKFAKNYESRWVGAVENQLVDVNKLMNIRTLTKPVLENSDPKREFVLGVDVARSANESNNKTAISVIEEIRSNNGLIKKMKLVNMYLVSNKMDVNGQACIVKRVQRTYNAKMVIVDANGLGRGLIDELFYPTTDRLSGEEYEPWTTNDPDYCSDYDNALPILYPLIAKAGQANAESNSTIIVNFISCVEGGKLQLLEEKKESDFDIFKKNGINDFAPYEQTNALVDEISNLQLVHLPSGGVTVKQVLNKIDKDRYSSLAYALWWIMTYDNKLIQDNTDLLTSIARMNCISNGGNNSLQKLFM